MKTLLLISIWQFLVAPVPPKTVDLLDAINQKMVEVKITSKGGYSGKCMKLDIKNISLGNAIIKISNGTHFIANNDNEQDIIVVQDQLANIEKNVNKSIDVSGFCSRSSRRSPSENSGFSVQRSVNENLLKLAEHINQHPLSEYASQDAVWAVSDGNSIANISDLGNYNEKCTREFIAKLLNKTVPWFEVKTERTVSVDRQIYTAPTEIKGDVTYTVSEKGNLDLRVYNPNGELRKEIFKDLKIDFIGTTTFNYKGKIQGWESGKYAIKVFLNDKEIHKQEFEI